MFFIKTQMSDKTYAMFNSLTITGRVSHAELVQGQYGEFLAVTLLTELKNDAAPVAVQFNTTNGLLALYKKGWLNNGRSVTVTGHVEGFTETYFNKSTGKRAILKRPRLTLSKAVVFDGGLGPAKREDVSEEVEIDSPPAVTPDGKPVQDL